jgi:hypothetical protein
MPNKLTDAEITIKALKEILELMLCDGDLQRTSTISHTIDLINRLQAEVEKFKKRQKPTGASGYKVENGKVVFFTNMLGGCRHEYKDLEEVVKTLNELLHEAYSKNEIVFALKCKTDELDKTKAEVERLQKENENFADIGKMYSEIKAEAYKEFAERLKANAYYNMAGDNIVFNHDVDNLLKELVGEDK